MWQESLAEREVTSLRAVVVETQEGRIHLRTASKGQALYYVGTCGVCTDPGAQLAFFAVELVHESWGWTIKELPGSRIIALRENDDIDLFIEPCCGLGAMSLGLRECGFRPVAAMDISKLAVDVYSANHEINALHGSIMDHTEMARLLEAADGLRCGLVAGFPCPPFSTRGDQRGFNDPRSEVFGQVLGMAYMFGSKYVILECTSQTGRWQEVQDYLRSLADAMDFGVVQNVLHLHRAWPCYRTRWWAVLAPLQVLKHLPALRDLPLRQPQICVEDIIPSWPKWPLADERALAWSSFEKDGYLKHSSEDRMLLSMKGVAPTILHSCGHHFYPCPCGCRSTGLAASRLERDGVSVIAIRSEHEEVDLRHLHPEEAGFLCTIFPGFLYPRLDLRAGLPLVGQLAAPMQSHWVGCQLKEAYSGANGLSLNMDFDQEALHLAFYQKLRRLNVHYWPSSWTLKPSALVLRFPEGNQVELTFFPGATVKELLHAQSAILGWGVRLSLWHDGHLLEDRCYLKSLLYDLVIGFPRSLASTPSGTIQVKIKQNGATKNGIFPAGTRVWQILDHFEISTKSGKPFQSEVTIAEQVWFSCEHEIRGGGLGNGIADVELENEAKQLLECIEGQTLHVHLLPLTWLAQTLAKPPIVANFLIKKHMNQIIQQQCPDCVIGLCCIDEHWLLYVYRVGEERVAFYDSLIGAVPREISTLNLALGEFFGTNLAVPPPQTFLTQRQDDFCGVLCLVNLGWSFGLWTSFDYDHVERWHHALDFGEQLRGRGATDYRLGLSTCLAGQLPTL